MKIRKINKSLWGTIAIVSAFKVWWKEKWNKNETIYYLPHRVRFKISIPSEKMEKEILYRGKKEIVENKTIEFDITNKDLLYMITSIIGGTKDIEEIWFDNINLTEEYNKNK